MVIALPNEEWGQIVAAIIVVEKGLETEWDLERVKKEMKKLVSPWKIPKRVLVKSDLPRNGMGKVQKKTLVSLFD